MLGDRARARARARARVVAMCNILELCTHITHSLGTAE